MFQPNVIDLMLLAFHFALDNQDVHSVVTEITDLDHGTTLDYYDTDNIEYPSCCSLI